MADDGMDELDPGKAELPWDYTSPNTEQLELDNEFLEACAHGDFIGAQSAVNAGANPQARDEATDENGLHKHCGASPHRFSQELFDYLVNDLRLHVDRRDAMENTAAHKAAEAGNLPALEALHKEKADFSMRTKHAKFTPEQLANHKGQTDAEAYLREVAPQKSRSTLRQEPTNVIPFSP